MHQANFEQRYGDEWTTLELILDELEARKWLDRGLPQFVSKLPECYRRVCGHYALSRQRRYSPLLTERLHQLVLRGHQQLYRQRQGNWLWRVLRFLGRDFPVALRKQVIYFTLSLALFLLPALIMGAFCFWDSDMIHTVLPVDQVEMMEQMYAPDNSRPGRTVERSSESNFTMFGYYIFNNIGIGFRSFAMGILAGIGTVFTMLYNGLVIGAVAGHLSGIGFHQTFWGFVSSHAPLELTAIVICGAAGLMLGQGLLAPGQLSRIQSIRLKAMAALPLVIGAGLMLLAAAFVEAFWSATAFPNLLKYGVATLIWILMTLYFIFAGRSVHAAQ